MKKQTKNGFTIVEISLAMLFLAILVVSVAILSARIAKIYQKGLAMRAINSAGTELMEDLSRTIGSTNYLVDISAADTDNDGYINSTEAADALKKYYMSYSETVHIENSDPPRSVKKQTYGVFCTGSYSYIWNTARALEDKDKGVYIRIDGKDEKLKMARVVDRESAQCAIDEPGTAGQAIEKNQAKAYVTYGSLTSKDVLELINTDESDIALYDFTVLPASQSNVTKQTFVAASFIMATRTGGIDISANGDFCRGNGNEDSEEFTNTDLDYCAINKFNFAMRTGGNVNKEG